MSPDSPVVLPDYLRYVAIEGVIGVGKTTLAKYLAERFGGHALLEAFEENPFLEAFYANPERWAFHTQLSFLASRFRQQKQLVNLDLFRSVVFSDYTFDKDRIFAHLNVKGDELQLYESLATLMESGLPVPDLVIYLQSTTDKLMERIAARGRQFEKKMKAKYIDSLVEAYNYYFFRYTKSPLLIVNASEIDFVKNKDELDEIVRVMCSGRHTGTVYFNIRPDKGARPGVTSEMQFD
jgi:deoxyadenosine/deoxycytidine kinase